MDRHGANEHKMSSEAIPPLALMLSRIACFEHLR
jgi:hypothetical protein